MSAEQVKAAKHLAVEKLESRNLLAGMSFFDSAVTLDAYNLQPGTGTLVGGGFPNQTPAIPVTSMGDFAPLAGFGFGGNANLMPNPGSFGTIGIGRTGAVNGNRAAGNAIRTADNATELSDPQGDGASGAPSAGSGVGQMTITTGANTPGIGSFATSTNGINSESGGTGRPGGRAAQREASENAPNEEGDVLDSAPGKASGAKGGGTTKTSATEGGE